MTLNDKVSENLSQLGPTFEDLAVRKCKSASFS